MKLNNKTEIFFVLILGSLFVFFLKAFNLEEMLQKVGVFSSSYFFSSNFAICSSLELRNWFAVLLGKREL